MRPRAQVESSRARIDGVVVRNPDGIHFTPAGGEVLAPKIMPAIVAVGRKQMASSGRAGNVSRRVTPGSGSRSEGYGPFPVTAG